MTPRLLLCVIIAVLTGAVVICRNGRDPDALLGTWHNRRDHIEFLTGGKLRFYSDQGVWQGRYEQMNRADIRVDLGNHWPDGESRYWYAMVQGDQLGLCEIRNGRHCLRFARAGERVRVLPR